MVANVRGVFFLESDFNNTPCGKALMFFLSRRAPDNQENSSMASGKVKWFDNTKGFGFIASESGQDVFVHHTSIMGSGFKTLNEGEEVKFEVLTGEKGLKAQNVERITPSI